MKSFIQDKTGTGFDPTKVKANIRMAVTRMNMQKNKLINSVKVQRRAIAELLAIEKYDSARIRVENCIREDVNIEGFEVLSLFLDLLANRVQLIAESKPLRDANNKKDPSSACPPELKEAITSVLWASARVGDTIPELANLRKAFENKYGKTFVEMAVSNAEYSVNQKMMDRLALYTPGNEKCIAYLTSIAKEYNLDNFDVEKLKDPNGLVASAAAGGGGDMGGFGGEAGGAGAGQSMADDIPGAVRTPSGMLIPPLGDPRDALEMRLLQLKRI